MIEIPGYALLRALGRGGMGEVYLALQQSLGREVALKILAPALSQDPVANERFVREARIAANLHHPHIVPIYEVGVHQGTAYIAMEFEPGGTVAALARERNDPTTALRIVRDIADALDHAHRKGVVHRDVKPENILRRAEGLCLLSDFGIARAVEAQTILTHEGASVGTPHYMSPEQLRGQNIDGRADLYSLGVVLYQLLTGQLPYTGSDGWALGMQHINEPIPRLPAELAHLQSLIDAMMAKDPNARPPTGAEVVSRIDALLAGRTPALTKALDAAPLPAARAPHQKPWLIGAAAAAALAVAAVWQPWRARSAPTPAPKATAADNAATAAKVDQASIAVLPFVNMSSDKDQEFFADGISEELLDLLAKIPELRVIARTSSFSFKGKEIEIAEIARRLNVAHVLEGSVRKSGNKLRITAQLIRAADSSHVWSETYDRDLTDIFAVQDEISAAVVAQLKLKLLGAAPKARAVDPGAFALFLQGRQLSRQNTAEGSTQAIALFQQVSAIDPNYAPAWYELGKAYINQARSDQRPLAESLTLAREAMNRALALDPEFAPAHAGLGYLAIKSDGDLATAAKHFTRAVALAPDDTDVLRPAGTLAQSLGRLDTAIALGQAVTARDPLNASGYGNLAYSYLEAGRPDAAIAGFRTALALSPGFINGHHYIGMALLAKGQPQAALDEIQQEPNETWRMTDLPMALHALGRKAESDAALAELIRKYEKQAAYSIAVVLAFRNEADSAFEWLDKAVAQKDRGMADAAVQPLLANLHQDPRWLPFLRKIGKAPEQLAAIKFEVKLPGAAAAP